MKSSNPALLNLLFGSIGMIIICCIPIVMPSLGSNKNNKFVEEFRSNEFQNGGTLLLFTSFPILLDVILDIFTKNVSKFIQYERIGRACYIIPTCLIGLHYSLQSNTFHIYDTFETSVWVALWFQRILFRLELDLGTPPVKKLN